MFFNHRIRNAIPTTGLTDPCFFLDCESIKRLANKVARKYKRVKMSTNELYVNVYGDHINCHYAMKITPAMNLNRM